MKSKKQKVVALSSAEVEFRDISKGTTKIIWLRKLLNELHFLQNKTCKVFRDNKAAISTLENPI